MIKTHLIETLDSQLRKATEPSKCRKCGCMKETLETIIPSLHLIEHEGILDILKLAKTHLDQMEAIEYS